MLSKAFKNVVYIIHISIFYFPWLCEYTLLFICNWAIFKIFSNIGAFLLLWNRQNVFMLPEKYSWEPRERPSQNIEFKLRLNLLIKSSENPKVCLGVGFQFSYIYDKNNDNDNITLERNFTSLRIIRWTPHLSENNWYSYYFISIFWTFLSLNQVHSTHNDQWISWFPSVGKNIEGF